MTARDGVILIYCLCHPRYRPNAKRFDTAVVLLSQIGKYPGGRGGYSRGPNPQDVYSSFANLFRNSMSQIPYIEDQELSSPISFPKAPLLQSLDLHEEDAIITDTGIVGETPDTKVLPHDLLIRSDEAYTEGIHNSLLYTSLRRPIVEGEVAANMMLHLQEAVVPATSPPSRTMVIVCPDDQTINVASVVNGQFVSIYDVQTAVLFWLDGCGGDLDVHSYWTESWNGLEVDVKIRLWRGLIVQDAEEGVWALRW